MTMRSVPEGTVPLVAVEGTAYECGQQYGQLVLQKYPGYRRYLDMVPPWRSLPADARRLFEQRAPYVLDIYRGRDDATAAVTSAPARASSSPADKSLSDNHPPFQGGAGGGSESPEFPPRPALSPKGKRDYGRGTKSGGCTSFGVAGSVTLDGQPISGQTKDGPAENALLFIVLRMRIRGGPTILVLAYPGEVLGYGLWSTGMSIFRNSVFSRGGEGKGLPMEQWGLLALAGRSVDEAVELALGHGISTVGNYLISDPAGNSVNVESNAGGVSVVPARGGICTHANHPVGDKTAPLEDYPSPVERENSRYRMARLRELLDGERGRLTAPQAMMFLAEHSRYPYGGICRHIYDGEPTWCTTAAVVVEPTRGLLHVTRGQPCANWPVTYTL